MRFNAASPEEILEKQVLKSGIYPYEIRAAKESTSAAGNEMIVLEISISVNGQSKMLQDYLVGIGRGLAKLHQLCLVCKLTDKYRGGVLSGDDFIGHTGKLRLGIENDRSKRFPPKNVIVDYLG
jgi:hypothetical protein